MEETEGILKSFLHFNYPSSSQFENPNGNPLFFINKLGISGWTCGSEEGNEADESRGCVVVAVVVVVREPLETGPTIPLYCRRHLGMERRK